MTRGVWRVWRKALAQRPDAFHLHDPELLTLAFVGKLQGARVVYDAHEDLPRQVLSKSWIRSSLRRSVATLTEGLQEYVPVVCDCVVAATPAIAGCFPPEVTTLVQNYPVLDGLSVQSSTPYDQRGPLVAYVGGISAIRGVREVVEALSRIPANYNVRLALAGIFERPEFEAELREMPGWEHVDFHGWLAREDMGRILDSTRMGVVMFHPEPNNREAQPNKLFEYMSVGIPLLASNFPLWEEIIHGSSCGLTVDPLDVDAIAEAIEWLLSHPDEAEKMGRRGRRAVEERYNWATEGEKLVKMYNRLLA